MEYDRYQYLTTERQPDGVLLITLSRPEVLNAAHEDMHTEMAAIWADIDKDDQTRVAVVTGPAGRSRPGATSPWLSGRSAITISCPGC